MILSFLLVVAVFRLLVRFVGMPVPAALTLALLFELSPYVFAPSFILLTDNADLLLAVLCLINVAALKKRPCKPKLRLVAAAGTAGAALATRQSLVWVVAVALFGIVLADLRPRLKVLGVTLVVVGVLPALWLFSIWAVWFRLARIRSPAGCVPEACTCSTGASCSPLVCSGWSADWS